MHFDIIFDEWNVLPCSFI